jgi:NADPH-dependent curcumin reductase CurA
MQGVAEIAQQRGSLETEERLRPLNRIVCRDIPVKSNVGKLGMLGVTAFAALTQFGRCTTACASEAVTADSGKVA